MPGTRPGMTAQWPYMNFVIARSEATKQSIFIPEHWIASRSLASGAHARDPLARNDGYFFTLLASILIDVSSSFVVNAVSTSNGFSMPR
jgi:hypothetical protein